jgi:hypothetical protein
MGTGLSSSQRAELQSPAALPLGRLAHAVNRAEQYTALRVQGGGKSLGLGSVERHHSLRCWQTVLQDLAPDTAANRSGECRNWGECMLRANIWTRSFGAVSIRVVVYPLSGRVAAWKGLVEGLLVLGSLTNRPTQLPA